MMSTVEQQLGQLKGLRVLVVEDSYLAAASMERVLASLGCEVIGPAPSVSRAMELLTEASPQAGILDINLGTETVEPVAREMDRQGKPYLFVTGYRSPFAISPIYREHRRLHKPIEAELLRAAMVLEFISV